jgi:universal stress protein E
MNDIHNILVIVDPTAREHPAVHKAARLAEVFNARLELFACETKESHALRYAAHLRSGGSTDFMAHIRAVLDDIARPLRQRGVDSSVEVTSGEPLHTKLLERIESARADLVVKDTHPHSLLKRTLITNTDWHLIRGCPTPLLLTKERPWSAMPVLAAAVDPGHVNDKLVALDHRILEWAQTLRGVLEGTLRVVHAYLPAVLMAEAVSGAPLMLASLRPEVMEDEKRTAFERVESLTASYGVSAADVSVQLGVPADVLPRFAREVAADILVMGAISRSGVQRVLIGSTAERVLEHLPCDVWVVKPPGFAAPA